jgi:hypothetical protein
MVHRVSKRRNDSAVSQMEFRFAITVRVGRQLKTVVLALQYQRASVEPGGGPRRTAAPKEGNDAENRELFRC